MEPVDPKDAALPKEVLVLPKDSESQPPKEEPVKVQVEEAVPAVPSVVAQTAPPVEKKPLTVKERMTEAKDNAVAWFKAHKVQGSIAVLFIVGTMLYLWPLITFVLVAGNMVTKTEGTENKMKMYKIAAIMLVVALSVQALWIVQLTQAASFGK